MDMEICIRKEKVADSKISAYMLTGPKSSQIYKNSKDNISMKCFKNRYGVDFLQMPLQVNKSLGSSIKCSFLGRLILYGL